MKERPNCTADTGGGLPSRTAGGGGAATTRALEGRRCGFAWVRGDLVTGVREAAAAGVESAALRLEKPLALPARKKSASSCSRDGSSCSVRGATAAGGVAAAAGGNEDFRRGGVAASAVWMEESAEEMGSGGCAAATAGARGTSAGCE